MTGRGGEEEREGGRGEGGREGGQTAAPKEEGELGPCTTAILHAVRPLPRLICSHAARSAARLQRRIAAWRPHRPVLVVVVVVAAARPSCRRGRRPRRPDRRARRPHGRPRWPAGARSGAGPRSGPRIACSNQAHGSEHQIKAAIRCGLPATCCGAACNGAVPGRRRAGHQQRRKAHPSR